MNTRKYGRMVMVAVMVMAALMLTLVMPMWADPTPLVGFSGPGIGINSSGRSNFIASANTAVPNALAAVTYLALSTNASDNVVTVWHPTATTCVVTNTGAGLNVPVARTNGFATGDIVVIRHRSTDTYERGVLGTLAATTNMLLAANQVTACAAGDIIYKMESGGTIGLTSAGGVGTLEMNADRWPLITARRPGPLLLTMTGTTIDTRGFVWVAGTYIAP